MKVVGVTYATAEFEPYARLLAMTGRRAGLSDFIVVGPSDLPAAFRAEHRSILDEPRGAGYWLWKPWAISECLDRVEDGDLVLWVDAGAHFAGPVDRIADLVEEHRLDVWLMGEGFRESAYTKRDAFVLLDADQPEIVSAPQRFASCIGFRRTDAGRALAAEHFERATDRRIITDDPNVCGLPNYPDFIDHRHDQSILSLLTKRARIPVVSKGLVVEGLQRPGQHVVNHTRRHASIDAVLRHVLSNGLISGDDARQLAAPR